MTAARPLLSPACLLGEAPLWDERSQTLYFVDLKQNRLHAVRAGEHRYWQLAELVCWLLPRRDGGFVLGLGQRIAWIDDPWEQQTIALHKSLEVVPPSSPLRLNDAKVSPQGDIWFGVMNNADESQPVGQLCRLQASNHHITLIDEGYCVPNGPAFSLDGRQAFHADSALRRIYAYALDDQGAVTSRQMWQQWEASAGYPDGMCCDAEGYIWIAHWGGASISRHDGEGREVLRLALPCQQPSSLCFGGVDYRSLFITSATIGLAAGPLDGAVFVLDSGVAGCPGFLFQG